MSVSGKESALSLLLSPSILSLTIFSSSFSLFLSHAPKPSSPTSSSVSCLLKMSKFLNIPFSLSLLFFLSLTISSAKESSFSDRRALLRFKSSITEDHLGLLLDWNPRDRSPCSWNGVACDPRSGRVVALVLVAANRSCLPAIPAASGDSSPHLSPDFSACYGVFGRERNGTNVLRGRLSPAVGELTKLRVLALGFYGFFGEIPQEVGKLRSLQVLDLGFNEFEGEVPPSLAGCVQLQAVNLAGNRLNSTVPVFFAGLQNLTFLSLSYNVFGGFHFLIPTHHHLHHPLHIAPLYPCAVIPFGNLHALLLQHLRILELPCSQRPPNQRHAPAQALQNRIPSVVDKKCTSRFMRQYFQLRRPSPHQNPLLPLSHPLLKALRPVPVQ